MLFNSKSKLFHRKQKNFLSYSQLSAGKIRLRKHPTDAKTNFKIILFKEDKK